MRILLIIPALVLLLLVLIDSFEVMVLPRRINHKFRIAVLFMLVLWKLCRSVVRHMKPGKRREAVLGVYGPVFMIALLAFWAALLVIAFATLNYALATKIHAPEAVADFTTYLYMSGVTLFTLGYGDVIPLTLLGRILTVMEAGMGFGFLAVVIGYFPVLHGAFSEREITISLLDGRAGSPPVAGEFLIRVKSSGDPATIGHTLVDWERWGAHVLESSLSFPILCYYRSQHDNQSWLAALTMMLDTCALILAGTQEDRHYQAKVTFAILRHAVVDLALVFKAPPIECSWDRFPPQARERLFGALHKTGHPLMDSPQFLDKLKELREMYEPFACALAERFLFTVPPMALVQETVDNWQTSAWRKRTVGIDKLSAVDYDGPGVH